MEFLQAEVPEEWEEIVLVSGLGQILVEEIPDSSKPYTWTQDPESNHITITFTEPWIDAPIITETTIKSDALSGQFFLPPSNLITRDNQIIEFDTTMEWPVLVSCGSEIDSYSCYLFGRLALKIGLFDEYYGFWMGKSCMMGFEPAQKEFGFMLLSQERIEEAMYWLHKCAIRGDEFSRIVLAQFCFESDGDSHDPVLSENILIDLAVSGCASAFYFLGYLHLGDVSDFEQSPELGVEYLTVCVETSHNTDAIRLLSQCYMNGLGCTKDEAKGLALIRTLQPAEEEEEEHTEQPEEKKEIEKPKMSFADKCATVIATVCIAGTGLFFASRLFRKK